MKINGSLVKPNEEVLVLPRMGGDLVIKACSVTTGTEFEALVPDPVAPGIRTRDGFKPDTKDETYRAAVKRRESQRFAYMILKSLEPSNIEWDKVSLDDPTTWTSWQDEMQAAGLSGVETDRIIMCVMSANSLDDEKLKAARDLFLLGQAE